jgi:SAM-dependent methyltransferase
MSGDTPICRLCGDTRAHALGAIPDSDYFAGRVLSEPIGGGRLWRCQACHSMFRHPVMEAAHYLRLYEGGAATAWSGGEHRLDCQLIRSILTARVDVRCVLDVGCGGGDFLASLPHRIQKFGVEPAAAAADQAAARGISVLAPTLDGLALEARFDAVTMIDVIEHLPSPSILLSQGYSQVAPGGILVISTGDPRNRIWRSVFRSRFWYCGFPEHLSFPSLGFFQRWCEDNPGASVSRRVTRYQRLNFWRAALACLMQLAYFASPSAFDLLGRLCLRKRESQGLRRQHFVPGVPGLFKDHQIVTIERARQT